jgi:hypothetical protein
MHSLVSPILLWMTRLDALVSNTEFTHQMDRRDKPPVPRLAKGVPLSVRIRSGKPNSRNTDSKDRLGAHRFRRPERLAAQEHPAECVRDSQRITTLVVTRLERARTDDSR